MSNDTVTKVFGGSPLAVLGRLILVSILVGVVLAALKRGHRDSLAAMVGSDAADMTAESWPS